MIMSEWLSPTPPDIADPLASSKQKARLQQIKIALQE